MEKMKPNIMVIDDDYDFCKFIKVVAYNEFGPLEITTTSSLEELGSLATLGNYDLVILDYYLETMKAEDICEYIETHFPSIPVVLISGETYIMKEDMNSPRCVRSFVSKACGVKNILETSLGFVKDRQGSNLDKKIS